jgi:UDP-N-acetylglucosamine diphosphorylase/glucosamine-1-phosphate N-acetyltransferase
MNICIFEDDQFRNLHPLALSRPVFDLRLGTGTLREKLERIFKPEQTFLITRDHLKEIVREDDTSVSFDIPAGPLLFVNGRLIADEPFAKTLQAEEDVLFFAGECLVAACVKDGAAFAERIRSSNFTGYETRSVTVHLIEYPWSLVEENGSQILKDFSRYGRRTEGITGSHLLNTEGIYLGNMVNIMPGTVIDAHEAPVIIDDEVTVMPNCYLKGPLYIGKRSLIKAGARIYGPTSIGDTCKIGGEVTGSIFHRYANKQHDGFIGHSYIGEWVNIGAGTNNSDLKNNYKDVTVYINNRPVDTQLTFVGTFMGDHSKTAINTILNTGTVVGFSVNIFGEGFPGKFIPSFSWGGRRKLMTYSLDNAIETAQRVMKRRNVTMSDAYRHLMRTIFEQTTEMRKHGN